MRKNIELLGRAIPYTIKKSPAAKNLRLSVSEDKGLTATLPWKMKETLLEGFMRKKAGWIISRLTHLAKLPPRTLPKISADDYKKFQFQAWELAHKRLGHFNQIYGLRYKRVSIKKQTSRWGSCSKKGNLNFNYRIVFLPPELQDYLIVHELCHLKEMNHSHKFWAEVGKSIPEYKKLRKKLYALR